MNNKFCRQNEEKTMESRQTFMHLLQSNLLPKEYPWQSTEQRFAVEK